MRRRRSIRAMSPWVAAAMAIALAGCPEPEPWQDDYTYYVYLSRMTVTPGDGHIQVFFGIDPPPDIWFEMTQLEFDRFEVEVSDSSGMLVATGRSDQLGAPVRVQDLTNGRRYVVEGWRVNTDGRSSQVLRAWTTPGVGPWAERVFTDSAGEWPIFAPSGRHVVMKYRGGFNRPRQLRLVDIATGEGTLLHESDDEFFNFLIRTTDPHGVAFISDGNLHRIALDGGTVAAQDTWPWPSYVVSKLLRVTGSNAEAWVKDEGPPSESWSRIRVDLDTGEVHRLGPTPNGWPTLDYYGEEWDTVSLSPSGDQVAYWILEPAGAPELVFDDHGFLIVSSAGLEAELLRLELGLDNDIPMWDRPPLLRFPSFSPDGRRLAFLSRLSGEPQLWIVDLADGRLWQVTGYQGQVAPTYVGLPVWGFDWSPTGETLVVSRKYSASTTQEIGGTYLIHLCEASPQTPETAHFVAPTLCQEGP